MHKWCCVCVSVCLSDSITRKLLGWTSPNFLCMLRLAGDRSSSGGVQIPQGERAIIEWRNFKVLTSMKCKEWCKSVRHRRLQDTLRSADPGCAGWLVSYVFFVVIRSTSSVKRMARLATSRTVWNVFGVPCHLESSSDPGPPKTMMPHRIQPMVLISTNYSVV